MRQPKPFFRKQTRSWYLRIGKQFISLGKDKEAAWDEYHEIMTKRAKGEVQAEGSVAKILDLYCNGASRISLRQRPIVARGFLNPSGCI